MALFSFFPIVTRVVYFSTMRTVLLDATELLRSNNDSV